MMYCFNGTPEQFWLMINLLALSAFLVGFCVGRLLHKVRRFACLWPRYWRVHRDKTVPRTGLGEGPH